MPQRDGNARVGHPDAAGWVLGALDPDEAERFAEHLRSCPECEAAVAELEPVAQMLLGAKAEVPDAAGVAAPPEHLQARTLARVEWAARLAGASAEPGAGAAGPKEAPLATAPGAEKPAAVADDAETPAVADQVETTAGTDDAGTAAVADDAGTASGRAPAANVISPAAWRRASTWAISVAAAVVIAVAVGVSVWLTRPAPAALAFTIPLHSPYGAAASGKAAAHHSANGWSIQLTVHGLKPLGSGRFYACWYAGPGNRPGHPELITAGTFTVGRDGSADVRMWSAADPRTFPTMQITAEQPGDAGQHGQIILSGSALR